MIACIQRVSRAEVRVDGQVEGRIRLGIVVLVGVAHDDTEDDARQLARKIAGLRLFEDENGKMNRSLGEVGGRALIVSQFTLLGDCRRGRRPSFTDAAGPEQAERLYERFCGAVAAEGVPVATGCFRRHMEVELVNDGPVTLLIDSRHWRPAGPSPPPSE